jgi:hypothetical protein
MNNDDFKILQGIETNDKLDDLVVSTEHTLQATSDIVEELKDLNKTAEHILAQESDKEEISIVIDGADMGYYKGEKGDKGDRGYTPVKGTDYFDGEDGKTPVKGKDYFTEEEIDGIIEFASEKAKPIKGKDYKDGRNGIDGRDGKDGVDGKDGRDGVDGKDGKDGSPDTGEKIVEKLSKLEKEKRLSYDDLKDTPNFDKYFK